MRNLEVAEAELVLEVIEQLVAELGLDLVPAEIDVDAATSILNEVINGEEEESADAEVGGPENEMVAEAAACAPGMERSPE